MNAIQEYRWLWRLALHDDDAMVRFGARCLILLSHAIVILAAAFVLFALLSEMRSFSLPGSP